MAKDFNSVLHSFVEINRIVIEVAPFLYNYRRVCEGYYFH